MTLGRWAFDVATARPRAKIAEITGIANTTRRAAHGVWTAARFNDNVHQDPKPFAVVGAEWFHSAEDKVRAVHLIDQDFKIFQEDLGHAMAARLATIAPEQLAADDQWVKTDVIPTSIKWQEFLNRETASWLARWTTNWDTFEDWQEKLKRLRELARARGIILTTAEPTPLPKTVWERGASGAGSTADTWLGMLKVVVLAGIGVTGFVTLFSVFRDLSKRPQT